MSSAITACTEVFKDYIPKVGLIYHKESSTELIFCKPKLIPLSVSDSRFDYRKWDARVSNDNLTTMYLLLLEIVVIFVFSAALLHRFGDWKRQNAVVILVVLISWYFSFLTVFVLPLDISSTVYRQCLKSTIIGDNVSQPNESQHSADCEKPLNYIVEDSLHRLWRIVYWSSQFLTWILLPLMQSYARAGEFTFYEKVKSALKDNILYYSSYLLICLVCLFYIIIYTDIPLDGSRLRAIASSASNTWGLFLLIILLGYALVDVPRKFWLLGNPQLCLLRSYFQLSKLTSDMYDAEVDLRSSIQKIQATVPSITEESPLKSDLQSICDIIPAQFHGKSTTNRAARVTAVPPSKQLLVQYHRELKSALHNYKRTCIQRELVFDQVFNLQKIVSDRKQEYHSYKDYLLQGPFRWPSKWRLYFFDYLWAAICKPITMRTLSLISIVMSAAVVWSEALFFKKSPVLSVFALLISTAKHHRNYMLIEILCILSLAYLFYCAYSTVFKIKIFNYYHFASEHQTDENSLIFSGMLLSRLTPPLCLNFLSLIHMDSHIIKEHIQETQYTQVMGHMDVISIIANGFNVYFPMVMIIISAATYFNLGSYLLSVVGFPQYFSDDEITDDIVTEGQRLAIAEKDRRTRKGLAFNPENIRNNARTEQMSRFGMTNEETATTVNVEEFETQAKQSQLSKRNDSMLLRNLFDDDSYNSEPYATLY